MLSDAAEIVGFASEKAMDEDFISVYNKAVRVTSKHYLVLITTTQQPLLSV